MAEKINQFTTRYYVVYTIPGVCARTADYVDAMAEELGLRVHIIRNLEENETEHKIFTNDEGKKTMWFQSLVELQKIGVIAEGTIAAYENKLDQLSVRST